MCVCIHPQPGILIRGLEAGQVTLIGCGMQPFMWALVTGLSLCMVACCYVGPARMALLRTGCFLAPFCLVVDSLGTETVQSVYEFVRVSCFCIYARASVRVCGVCVVFVCDTVHAHVGTYVCLCACTYSFN